jgi:hypothetical protein
MNSFLTGYHSETCNTTSIYATKTNAKNTPIPPKNGTDEMTMHQSDL